MFQITTFQNNNNNNNNNNTNTTQVQNNQNNNINEINQNQNQPQQQQQQPQQEDQKKSKSIIELQKEINYYKNKERVYKLQLIEKQKKINELKELKSYYENIKKNHKDTPPDLFRKDQLFDVRTQKLLLALKKIIEDKNSILLSLEEELYSSSPKAITFFTNQLRFLQKENLEIYNCVQGSNIDNFKKENTNEKNQLNALLVKIEECQENIKDLLKNLDDINDTSSMLRRKNTENDK